ncbi:lactoylglutathione lyase [Klebsormidium nitens]|uniref:Lactoylglutathione lyase n=1 Tax=Klebsormidium nitens TaxID=105231 RepID=A0A1Y1ICV3_KLENI|nr:lactoylglutathione lyase [Klebsormidium nitens]|eukprot:GAQ85908.1 lactoylglutathione lyase [Klebsormidium nitens]
MGGPIPGVELVHIARETDNVDRLVAFYTEILGFKRMDTPTFGPFQVAWLEFPPSQQIHIIQRNPDSKLPESPLNAGPDSRKDPSALPRGHHLSFRVSDYDAAVKSLKEKGFDVFEKDQQGHTIKQAFFFDPDGNGIEIGSWPK